MIMGSATQDNLRMGRNEECSMTNIESTKRPQLASVYTKSLSFIGTQSSVGREPIRRHTASPSNRNQVLLSCFGGHLSAFYSIDIGVSWMGGR